MSTPNHILSPAFKNTKVAKKPSAYRADEQNLENIKTKMVKGLETKPAVEDEFLTWGNQQPFIKNAIAKSVERIRDNNNILQLLPDIKQAIEIIIGGVLSPKDFTSVQLTYSTNSDYFDDKSAALLLHIENHFNSSYKLKPMLPVMLEDILSKTGSFPLAVLPETSVDFLINSDVRVTMESLGNTYTPSGKLKNIGILANAKTNNLPVERSIIDILNEVSTENFNVSTEEWDGNIGSSLLQLTVTDNYDILKMPTLTRKASSQAQLSRVNSLVGRLNTVAKKTLHYSSEAIVQVTPEDHKRTIQESKDLMRLYPERVYNQVPVQRVKTKSTLEKPTMGHPLVLKLPTEAVIPVFVPSDPSDHIGYFIALDATGNPVRLSELDNIYRMLSVTSNANPNMTNITSYLIQNAANQMNPQNLNSATGREMWEAYNQTIPIYTQLVESELLDRLERGVVGAGVTLGKIDDVYRIMLARALMNKKTQLLYLPASLLGYLAIDYDEFGLGKTLLDDSKLLAALRSMQLLVNSMASSKNAITRRILKAAIDPAEKNPQKAEEIIIHEFVKGTMAEYPLTNSPVDQINYLQRAGIQVEFEEHPRLPNTQVSVDYLDNNYKQIDTDFDEFLKNQHSQALGLSPEVVEGAGRSDFATQAIFQNIITTRRIKIISDKFCNALSDFVRKYVYNSQILMDKLIAEVKQNEWSFKNQFGESLSDEEIATYFVSTINVSLPTPDLKTLEEQKEAYETYKAMVEEVINVLYSEEYLTEDMLGKIGESGYIDSVKKFATSKYLREWLQENGIMTEMFDLLMRGKDGKPLVNFLEDHEEYMTTFSEVFLPLAEKRLGRKSANDKKMEAIEEKFGGGDEYGGSDDYGSDDSSGDGDDFDDEGGEEGDGMDDFDMGDEGEGGDDDLDDLGDMDELSEDGMEEDESESDKDDDF